ncbi:MAG: hypothetical protein AAF587_04715 [Bacteroidota bacterium]
MYKSLITTILVGLALMSQLFAQSMVDLSIQSRQSISADDPIILALQQELKGDYSLSEGEKILGNGKGKRKGEQYLYYLFPQQQKGNSRNFLIFVTRPGDASVNQRRLHDMLMSIVRGNNSQIQLSIRDMNGTTLGGAVFESQGSGKPERLIRTIPGSSRNSVTDCLDSSFGQPAQDCNLGGGPCVGPGGIAATCNVATGCGFEWFLSDCFLDFAL